MSRVMSKLISSIFINGGFHLHYQPKLIKSRQRYMSLSSFRMVAGMEHKSDFLQLCAPSLSSIEDKCHRNPFALILVNNVLPWFAPFLWSKAQICLCADGGANHLYDEITALVPHKDSSRIRERFKPDVIQGDLDSVRPEVRDFYSKLGTIIIDEGHKQDTTDLHKCMSFFQDSESAIDKTNLRIIVLGALGGRLDHEFANFNVLYSFATSRIILMNEESLTFLLPKNSHHKIFVDQRFEGPHCGLIPLGHPSEKTTTTGLRWNLVNSPMKFGSLISTSNLLESNVVTVFSDSDLLWTISIRKLKDQTIWK